MKKINQYSFIKSFLKGNIYMTLLWRLLLVFAIYSLIRILFYILNYSYFGSIPFKDFLLILKGGLRFDASAIVYTNSLVILMHILPFRFRYSIGYQKVMRWIYIICNSLCIIVNAADIVYYRFTLRRTTLLVLKEFQNENPLNFVRFIWDYWYITLICVILIALLLCISNKIKAVPSSRRLKNSIYYPISIVLMGLIGIESAGMMRGGWQDGIRPITLSNATIYISRPKQREIVLNTPFALIRTMGKAQLKKKNYYSSEELNSILKTQQTTNPNATYFGKFKGRNVVLIIWESFSREWVGSLNKDIPNYKGYTPFIDSLIQKSYVFENAFANGRKSIDAIPSVIASIPALQTPFILSNYSGNNINSLPNFLQQKRGDYSAFFHGAHNGSMGFDAFTKQAEIENYYGYNEYGNPADYDGHWGIWDEPFLQFMAKKLNTFQSRFISTVFTVSSHHPYKIPAKYENKFPLGHIPIHKCIGYTDYSLNQFFKTASKEPWFDNTLFVITADHAVNGDLKEYKSNSGAFKIPMILYAPNSDFSGLNTDRAVQQLDVMPTVLSLLGIETEYIAFGNNMFDDNANHFAVNYINGLFQIIEDDYLLQFENDKTVGFYNLKEDPMENHNLYKEQSPKQRSMERKIKAYLQQFNERMIDNNLTVKKPMH